MAKSASKVVPKYEPQSLGGATMKPVAVGAAIVALATPTAAAADGHVHTFATFGEMVLHMLEHH